MFSSKKIVYFITMALLLLCYARNINFMQTSVVAPNLEIVPDYAQSGFTQMETFLPDVSDPNGASNTSTSEENPQAVVDDTTTSTEVLPIDQPPIEPVDQPDDPPVDQPDDPPVDQPPADQPGQEGVGDVVISTTTTTTTTTTTRTTTTTTTTTTTRATTTTTRAYFDSGSIYFSDKEITLLVGENATNVVGIPIGAQKRVYFTSKDSSIVQVSAIDETSVRITGVSTGVTWVQAMSPNGDVAFCKVIVTSFADQVLALTNAQRRYYNLSDLAAGSELLDSVASLRLRESQSYFNHIRPNGQRFYTAATDLGVSYRHIGENLACGQTTPAQVVNEWMASPTHRANILNSDYQYLSIAYGIGADGFPYWVQIFYTPK